VPHNVCPICLGPWVAVAVFRHHSDASPVVEPASPAELMCPPCEVAFERALWVAFDTTATKDAAYREAERVTVSQRRTRPEVLARA
jgi:hypothetical protein